MTDSDVVDKIVSMVKEPFASLRKASTDQVVAMWQIGKVLFDETESAQYGDGVIQGVADRLVISPTKLYDMRQLAQWWPTREQFDVVLKMPEAVGEHGHVTSAQVHKIGQRKANIALPQAEVVSQLRVRIQAGSAKLGALTESLNEVLDEDDEEGRVDVFVAQSEVESYQAIADLTHTDPWRNESWLSFVREHCCCVCGSRRVIQAHHIKPPDIPQAIGEKAGDDWAIPLCAEHHDEFEKVGVDTWEVRYGSQWVHLGQMVTRGIRVLWRSYQKT